MTIRVKIEPRGLDAVGAKVAGWIKDVEPTMAEAGEEVLEYWFANKPGYPAAPSGSTYSRTMQLGDSLAAPLGGAAGALSTVKVIGGEVETTIGTGIPYANFPIGDRQAWMHRGRWWTLSGAVKKMQSAFNGIYRKAMAKLFGIG